MRVGDDLYYVPTAGELENTSSIYNGQPWAAKVVGLYATGIPSVQIFSPMGQIEYRDQVTFVPAGEPAAGQCYPRPQI